MTTHMSHGIPSPRLRCGIVLRVREDACEVLRQGERAPAGYAAAFPSPRTERVSPGHLVALATAAGASELVVFRWYDAVVLGQQNNLVRLWEPAHGEVLASPRAGHQPHRVGTRAYLSAGLPGAEWWVAGGAARRPEDADVELEEVERFCTEHDLWSHLL